ncbi:MAG: 4-hydroxythreonine-4-phosphate dehydrogenase PdxA [Thermodesulfobacteriota bacterium]
MKPTIAVSMGDPAGVGPEIILRACADARVRRSCAPVVVGDRGLLDHLATRLKLPRLPEGMVRGVTSLDLAKLVPGVASAECGRAMVAYIEEAVRMASSGEAAAVVTAPITKEAARLAGFGYPGHTEFIAHLTGTKDFRMMLGGAGPKDLKVVLVTIHVPLKDVPVLVTRAAVYKTLCITAAAFERDLGVKRPRIAVAGLNPHAGEAGMFGDEEKRVIAPAVSRARSGGIDAVGPLPADTVFYRAVRKNEFDCVVCMYHDQGLGPLKLLHFEDGVNATLGLPIVRTSPDHGTAYDIAWKGKASAESLVCAVRMAVRMARNRGR